MLFPRGTINIYDGSDLFSAGIRIFSGSGYSHCSVSLGDGSAIQCDMHVGGVGLENEGQTMKQAQYMYPGDVEKFINLLMSCKGDKYDYCNLLANPLWNIFHIKSQLTPHKWTCSSFLAWAMWQDAAIQPLMIKAFGSKPLAAYIPQDFEVLFKHP